MPYLGRSLEFQLNNGDVTNPIIAADAVTADKIATGAVGTDEIQDGSIAEGDLATAVAQKLNNIAAPIFQNASWTFSSGTSSTYNGKDVFMTGAVGSVVTLDTAAQYNRFRVIASGAAITFTASVSLTGYLVGENGVVESFTNSSKVLTNTRGIYDIYYTANNACIIQINTSLGAGGSFSGCQINGASTAAIANTATVTVSFTAADTFDVGDWHDNVTNNQRITIPAGVSYAAFSYWIRMRNNSGGSATNVVWQVKFQKNGVDTNSMVSLGIPGHSSPRQDDGLTLDVNDVVEFRTAGIPVPVSPGDYFTATVTQSNGSAATMEIIQSYAGAYKVA